jgi:hypothetical protein
VLSCARQTVVPSEKTGAVPDVTLAELLRAP